MVIPTRSCSSTRRVEKRERKGRRKTAPQTSRPPRGKFRNVSSRRWRSSQLSRSTVPQFLRPHHVLRPRDRCRTITPLLLIRVLPEPVHAALSETKMSTITHLARVPGKELPQEAPSNPVPVCPPPALADLHDAHPHPGFTMRQHSAHVENSSRSAQRTVATLFPDRG